MAQLSRKALRLLSVKQLLHPHIRVAWVSTHRAIIFDMFGVLIPSPFPKATEWEDKNGVPRGTIGQAIRTGGDGNAWRKYMRGELGPEEFVEAFSRDCSQIVGFKVDIGSFHSALTSDTMTRPLTVMMEAVQCARAEGLKTAVLSNNFLLPGGKSYMPLDPSLFDVIVESCRVGLCKPDPRIYQLCADRLGVSPQEAVFLDDLSCNVEAAERVGMHCITVRDPAEAVKELEEVLKVPLSGFVPGTRSVRQSQQLPMDRLTQYLNSAVQLPQTEPVTVRQFSHSHSNSTYLLSWGGCQLVLKKKANTEALRKECRLLKALNEDGVPVPDVIANCEVPSVLDTPFYLRSYCQGRVFNDPSLPGLDADEKKYVFEAMIQTLCQIHRVDLGTTGLEDLREQVSCNSGDFMEFEVKRLAQQYKAHETQPIPAMNRLIEWLLLHLPEQQKATLLHGAFRLNNLVFDSEKPEVRAVLGWSLSTVGDPLVDVASCCMSQYLSQNTTQPGNKLASVGIPNAEELFELYSKAMGLESIPHWQFYMAFSFFHQAVILQANHISSLKVTASTRDIEDMAELAWVFAIKEGFRIFNAVPKAAGF
ncbi:acyl-CoA dehydrogenase family member 10-like [Colossoma macropomum]|uniref:acyl-CoA dehydrogenase family member 10-like n=1 Tax=Colossoma macropomum TaxID=42526 RepID=UPI001864EB4C|nr:acyl-CoA dehydrogenase family member 10-like [Colossoma macropomum]XP_036454873.1 acyl-CoA dehydrogenase family member 10-like [Colossoma macropomum]